MRLNGVLNGSQTYNETKLTGFRMTREISFLAPREWQSNIHIVIVMVIVIMMMMTHNNRDMFSTVTTFGRDGLCLFVYPMLFSSPLIAHSWAFAAVNTWKRKLFTRNKQKSPLPTFSRFKRKSEEQRARARSIQNKVNKISFCRIHILSTKTTLT